MENMLYYARKKITMDKFSSQVKISANSVVKKVLNVEPNAVINSCECVNGIVSISGKIKATVVYVNQNNLIESTELYFDFIEKQQITETIDDIFAEDKIEMMSVNFSGMDIICIFEHNVCLNGNYKYEIPSLIEDEQSFVSKKTQFNATKYILSCDDNFVVADEGETNLNNMTVLSANATVVLTEVIALVDKVSIEGKIISNLSYLDEQGVGQYSKEFDFKQEISASGVVPNMIVNAFVGVKDVTSSAEDNDGKTNLVISVSLYAKAMIYEDCDYEVIDDMFSLKNVIQTKFDYIEASSFIGLKNYNDTFMNSTDISKIENFDDILGVYSPKLTIDSFEEYDDKCYLIANIESIALYKSGEEINELKTTLPVKIEVLKEQKERVGGAFGVPQITSYKVKAGKNLEIVYSVNYNVSFEKSVNVKYLQSYELKSEKNDNEGGIKIYITREGETLFDVAKSLNIKPETITSQNNVADYFEQGEKIYVYSPINLYN